MQSPAESRDESRTMIRNLQSRLAQAEKERDHNARILASLPGSPSVLDLANAARFQMERADKAERERGEAEGRWAVLASRIAAITLLVEPAPEGGTVVDVVRSVVEAAGRFIVAHDGFDGDTDTRPDSLERYERWRDSIQVLRAALTHAPAPSDSCSGAGGTAPSGGTSKAPSGDSVRLGEERHHTPAKSAASLVTALSARFVQALADSEPSGEASEGMEKLRGTCAESLFVVEGDVLRDRVEWLLENAIADGEIHLTPTPAPLGGAEGGLERAVVEAAVDYMTPRPGTVEIGGAGLDRLFRLRDAVRALAAHRAARTA